MFLFLPISDLVSSWSAGKASGRPKCGLKVPCVGKRSKVEGKSDDESDHTLDCPVDVVVTTEEDVGIFFEALLPLLEAGP